MMEMISRIKAGPQTYIQSGTGNSFDNKKTRSGFKKITRLEKNGQKIELTLKEFELLSLLMLNLTKLLHICRNFWSKVREHFIGETRTVDVHIGTLRMKLGDASHLIKTVRGVGYRLEVTDD